MNNMNKKALLMSVVSLIICVTMLIGTTFAWFTDTATTAVNQIKSGTLLVDLEMKDDDGNWVSAVDEVLDFVKSSEAPEGEMIYWEPGCEYALQDVRVINNGSLALKYKVEITGINGDDILNRVIDWTIKIGDTEVEADSEFHLTAGESHELTIVGKMQESAGNDYMNKKIENIAITVVATQDTVEYDSNGNTYDQDATYNGEVAVVCNHENTEIVSNEDGTHKIVCTNPECGATVDTVNCTDLGHANGHKCECGYTVTDCSITSYTYNRDGTHTPIYSCGANGEAEACDPATGSCAKCNNHVHVYTSAWIHDDDNHWHVCTATGCTATDNKVDLAAHTYTHGYCQCGAKDSKLSTVVNTSTDISLSSRTKLVYNKTYTQNTTITLIINGTATLSSSESQGTFAVMTTKVDSQYNGAVSSSSYNVSSDGSFTIIKEFTLNSDTDGFVLKDFSNISELTVAGYSVYEGTLDEYNGTTND